MIKIRYRDPNELSPGLHAAAERHGRSTTIYLLAGLSSAQRRAALRRLTISARRGYDPKLPAAQLALALLADGIRTTVGRAGAVFRSHPAGSTVPVMVVSAGAITFLALSAVSSQVSHTSPRGPGQGSAGAAGTVAPFSAGPGPGPSAEPIAAGLDDPPGQPGRVSGPSGQPGSGARQQGGQARGHHGNGSAKGTAGPGHGAGSASASADPPAGSGGGTTLGGAVPTPSAGGDPSSAAPGASSAATTSKPAASSKPPASQSGLCVTVGSLDLCLPGGVYQAVRLS
jgi:hypothetical protein